VSGNARPDDGDDVRQLARGVRLDLVIAVCALLVSTLATVASWWQTRVIQQQLSAQIWPYLTASETLSGPSSLKVSIENDGLGPAIIRSAVVTVDAHPVNGMIGMLHAIVGPHIFARVPHGEAIGLGMDTGSPGSVIRPGESLNLLNFTNKRFAPAVLAAYERVDFRTCYCAILPGTCWLKDSLSNDDPRPVPVCPEVPGDLLHQKVDSILEHAY
jgi:hypothetical protein